VKTKKGQILVLVLMLMAVGLIIMSPLLRYLDSSFNVYSNKWNEAMAYYTADAMIGKIFNDLYAAKDIYILNNADTSRYNNESATGWLNGFKINTSISKSIAFNPPPPNQEAGWIYLDPACSFGLDTLAHDDTHYFPLYLNGGMNVTVNWYFMDQRSGTCNYNCSGSMKITYENGSTVKDGNGSDVATGAISNGLSVAFDKQLSWDVPESGTGNYTIQFQNLAYRFTGSSCSTNQSRDMEVMYEPPTYSGIGETGYTWVRLGDTIEGKVYQYEDYTITTIATLAATDTDIVRLDVCVRQLPGPGYYWLPQELVVLTWQLTYL
jgi:hypothetical protein